MVQRPPGSDSSSYLVYSSYAWLALQLSAMWTTCTCKSAHVDRGRLFAGGRILLLLLRGFELSCFAHLPFVV